MAQLARQITENSSCAKIVSKTWTPNRISSYWEVSELFSERGLILEILSAVTIRAKGSVFQPCLNCALAGKTRWKGVSWMELPSKILHSCTTFYSMKRRGGKSFSCSNASSRDDFFAPPHCRSFNIRRTKKQDDLIREIKPRRLPTLLPRNNTNE